MTTATTLSSTCDTNTSLLESLSPKQARLCEIGINISYRCHPSDGRPVFDSVADVYQFPCSNVADCYCTLLYSDKHLIIFKIRALDPKESIRDFELSVAGSFYHSNFSPLLPISKRDLSPRSGDPAWPLFLHPLSQTNR